MSRPLMQAVAAQQRAMATLEHENSVLRLQLAYVARLAGISDQFAAIRKECDADNPAQPVPNPASQPATESTEEALKPEAMDNPNSPGQTPGANEHVPAETTTTPMDVGTTLPTNPYNNLVSVTAPVSGTETHVPNEQTRIETDVRVGNPMNPETAFPLNPAFGDTNRQSPAGKPKSGEMSQTGSVRVMAALHLAKLRMQAGYAESNDEFEVVAAIEADQGLSVAAMESEIRTLTNVAKAASRQPRPANLVPTAAAATQRPIVSLASGSSAATSDDDDAIFF